MATRSIIRRHIPAQKLYFHERKISNARKCAMIRCFSIDADSAKEENIKQKDQIIIVQTHYQKTSTGSSDVRKKVVRYSGEVNGKLQQVPMMDSESIQTKSLQEAVSVTMGKLADLLLPKGFPDTVGKGYFRYAMFQSVGAIFGSATGVLSTQSLLYAMGLGAGALPLAATLNWVIKDGVGMMGGIAFASFVNNRFDADPRFWRFTSALMNDLSCYIEMLSPLAPQYFLPMACTANIGKNISFLAASASRAGIHSQLALRQNLADLTGKAGSQTMLASIAGTALGVSVSTFVGENWSMAFACLGAMSTVHLTCQYLSLQKVVLNTINLERLHILVDGYQKSSVILSPDEVNEKDSFLPSPDTVLSKAKSGIKIGAPLHDMFQTTNELIRQAKSLKDEGYMLSMKGTDSASLIFKEDCSQKDILKGTSHAMFLATSDNKYSEGALEATNDMTRKFMAQLEKQGWKTDVVFLEENTVRYSISSDFNTPKVSSKEA